MLSYAGQREQFGKPLAGHQLVQELLADAAVDVDASRLLTWAAAYPKTRGVPYSLAAFNAKLFATEASVRVANSCIQVHGGYGYLDEFPGAKLLRDTRAGTLYERHDPDSEAPHRPRAHGRLRFLAATGKHPGGPRVARRG